MSNETIVLGTRGSRLALYQAEQVARLLSAAHPRLSVRIQEIQTQGDRDRSRSLDSFRGVGVFVKELERALTDQRIDAAVHSLKDMPTEVPSGLCIAAVPIREEWRDALCSASGKPLGELRAGAKIATGSPRRAAQLLALRPDVEIVPIRGNVETRLRKMREQGLDGVVLSYAGLLRLGLGEQVAEVFGPADMLPAPGQGAIAVEARSDDSYALEALAAIRNERIERAVAAERALLRRLGGGCHAAIGALAEIESGRLKLQGGVGSPHGEGVVRAEATGDAGDPEALACLVADKLLAQGAGDLLED